MGNWRDYEESMQQEPEIIIKRPAVPSVNIRVEQEYEQLNETNEVLSDVEKRLHKANLYRLILENPLIDGGGDSLAQEVETEIRDFVLARLRILMGIGQESRNIAQSDFSEEEVKALKLWAGKLLNKPSVMAIEPKVNPAKPVVKTVSTQLPTVRAVTAPERRGRGRPPGTGKHQIAAAQAATQTPSKPQATETSSDNKKVAKVQVETPDGSKTVELNVTPMARPLHKKPAPMPSPDEMLAMEMARATINENALNNSILGKTVEHFTKE